MLRPNDLYTVHDVVPLADGDGNPVGMLINDYDVRAFSDVRGLRIAYGFVISVSQRIIIPATLSTSSGPTYGYENYPIYVVSSITPKPADGGVVELIHYSPITVNSSVDSSVNSSDGTSTGDTQQHQSGSSTAVTNTFDVQVNLSKMGGVSGGYSHSTTSAAEQSDTIGKETRADVVLGSSDAMSVKEWGCFLSIDPVAAVPTWTWAQEYPWNALVYGETGGSGDVVLPGFVYNRLFLPEQPQTSEAKAADLAPVLAAPPSGMSMRGLTFLSKARWTYFPTTADSVSFVYGVTYALGKHLVKGDQGRPSAALTSCTPIFRTTTTIDSLNALALEPISSNGRQTALISFVPSQFRLDAPVAVAPNNTLLITATNFAAPDGNGPLCATLAPASPTARLQIAFKVTDPEEDYSLYLKHWKGSDTGVTLAITINGHEIVRHVDAKEGQDGSDNVSRIILRNSDYTTSDVYDYLILGFNTVIIDATSDDGTANDCRYAVRAVAIG